MSRILRCINDELRDNAYTLLFGLVLGLIATATAFYQLPVVTAYGEIVRCDTASVTVHVWGIKHRRCRYIDIAGYASKGGVMFDASATRIDIAEDGVTRPLGSFDAGTWRIEPITGAEKALLWVTHSCGPGDIRITQIAEVML